MKFCCLCHKLFLFRLPLNLPHIITQQIRLNGFSLLGKRNKFKREMSLKKKEREREGEVTRNYTVQKNIILMLKDAIQR